MVTVFSKLKFLLTFLSISFDTQTILFDLPYKNRFITLYFEKYSDKIAL